MHLINRFGMMTGALSSSSGLMAQRATVPTSARGASIAHLTAGRAALACSRAPFSSSATLFTGTTTPPPLSPPPPSTSNAQQSQQSQQISPPILSSSSSPPQQVSSPRTANRIVMFCTAINDHTSWPFWKFLQMKKIKGVTDLVMLAVTTESGTFEARIDGTEYSIKSNERVKQFRPDILASFLDRWHVPGHTYFVYGGHGMGDYLELEQWVTALQCHELAAIMGKKQYQGILFDACFMANLDCAYYLRNNTRYIGASEGYMWEHDTDLDKHIFNTYTASAMSRFKDPLTIFQLIQRDYCNKTHRGDFAVLDTAYAEPLYNYCQKHVVPRIYDRVSFFTDEQQSELEELAHEALGPDADAHGNALNVQPLPLATSASNSNNSASSSSGNNANNGNTIPKGGDVKSSAVTPSPSPPSPSPPAPGLTSKESRTERVGYASKREVALTRAIQYEHSLYPAEIEDKHVLDLFQYLVDIAREEQMASSSSSSLSTSTLGEAGKGPAEPLLVLPSRTLNASLQGKIPTGQVVNAVNLKQSAAASPSTSSPSSSATTASTPCTIMEAARQGNGPNASSPLGLAAVDARTIKLSEGLELFNKVVVSHTPPHDEKVYATKLGGLSIVAPELSAMSKTLQRTNYHRAAFRKKAAEFLKKKSVSPSSSSSPSPVSGSGCSNNAAAPSAAPMAVSAPSTPTAASTANSKTDTVVINAEASAAPAMSQVVADKVKKASKDSPAK